MAKAVSGVHKHVVSDVLFMRRCIRCPDLHCRGTARPGYPNREKMWRKWGKRKYRKWWYQFRPHTRTSISSLLQHSYLTMPENGVASSQKNKLHLHAIMMRSYSSPPCLCFSFSSPPFHIGFFGSLHFHQLRNYLFRCCVQHTISTHPATSTWRGWSGQ